MNRLEDGKERFVLFWSPRCACTSLRYWAGAISTVYDTNMMTAKNGPLICNRILQNETPKILVIRSPLKRFASVLNHFEMIPKFTKEKSKKRIDIMLDILEKKGHLLDHHTKLQCYVEDDEDLYKTDNFSSNFNHILKLEDGSLISRLNAIVGTNTKNFYANSRRAHINKKKALGIETELVDAEDFTEKQIDRIKKIYYWDFKHFYSELL